jgi:hypothetical protein
VIGMAGIIENESKLQDFFHQLICINNTDSNLKQNLKNARSNLERAAENFGRELKHS